ncbi:MAG: Uma2 family endonuclease [Ardenticatenales bacterium]|nr:Uma2 family endonuclease [Ardenticatenales bacterium]
MSSQPKSYLPPQEYLALERKAEFRSEYFKGELYAMTGASREHNLIVGNTLVALHGQLRGRPCEVYASDMRVKVSATGLYTYPDVVVVCGEAKFEDEQVDTLLNPTLIIEVLSKSTERYDRGAKFEQYRTLDSLTDYILIAQDKHLIEHFSHQENKQWLFTIANSLQDSIYIASIECDLVLETVYERIEMEIK